MLPSLHKINDRGLSATDNKNMDNPFEPSEMVKRRDQGSHESGGTNRKIKAHAGFKISAGLQDNFSKGESLKVHQSTHNNRNRFPLSSTKNSSTDTNLEIKLIDKKIRQCQRKIEEQKRRKQLQDERKEDDQYAQDFQKIIRKELALQGYKQQPKGFDYLTNPGGAPPQNDLVQEPQQQESTVNYNINDNVQKLQRFYQNSLKKKFERRQMLPHKACKRKTPQLYITQKANAVNKVGKPHNEQEHKFRVMTKETTPQQIYPVIPNFAVVKDNLSKNILAYLGDYKPFIQKTKQKLTNDAKIVADDILVENNKSLSISN